MVTPCARRKNVSARYTSISKRHGLQRQERTADRLDRIHRTHGIFRDNDAQIVVTIIGWCTISTGAKEINCLGFDSFRDNPAHRLQFFCKDSVFAKYSFSVDIFIIPKQ